MTWFAIYQQEDGILVSGTNDQTKVASADVLAARGYAVAQCPDGSQSGVWNVSTHQFDPAPPSPVNVSPDNFVALFTPAETVRIFAAAQLPNPQSPELFYLLRQLDHRSTDLDLLGTTITQGLAVIAALGLFDDQNGVAGAATQRPAAIQAWRP